MNIGHNQHSLTRATHGLEFCWFVHPKWPACWTQLSPWLWASVPWDSWLQIKGPRCRPHKPHSLLTLHNWTYQQKTSDWYCTSAAWYQDQLATWMLSNLAWLNTGLLAALCNACTQVYANALTKIILIRLCGCCIQEGCHTFWIWPSTSAVLKVKGWDKRMAFTATQKLAFQATSRRILRSPLHSLITQEKT